MASLLDHYQTESSRYRTWNAVLGVARGAVSIPIGGFVLSKDFVTPGVLMVATGTIAATSGLLDLLVYREPFEELRANFCLRRSSGTSSEEVIDQTEHEWVAKAKSVRSARLRGGVLALGLGTLLVGVGAAVGLDALTLTSESADTNDRSRLAALLLTIGGTNLTSGLHSILVADPLESGWQSYTRARAVWGQARIHVMPLSSGGYVGLSATF